MSYSKANYRNVGAEGGALHFLRDELDCENLGITVIDAEPGWEGMEHDHADEGQEEVYLLTEGQAAIEVDNEVVQLEEGDAIRVSADEERKLVNGDTQSTIVAVGAP
ncbi:cupin domain-containing protein [Candidatus Nanohaloarchaea archaeon]|nr:cupin domain-containing protein [Candidatus Nanohaloarchaea archaeon]